MILDQRLVHSVNSGRCFALVGSGPSCELGYPSWAKLAEGTYRQLVAGGLVKDAPSYDKFLQNRKFPELLRQAEIDAGGRIQLIEIVKSLLVPEPGRTGYIYDYLIKWPFACYLTTNFDDELQKRLATTGCHYQTVGNRVEDFYAIRDGASHLIVKLHSDLQHPAEVVLTSEDYHKVATSDGGKYFRDKLRSIMETFDVCIIGHSISDCDLRLVLQTAKDTASPDHPIFMLAADFTAGDEREAFERYNIVVTTYDNPDGQHAKLRRILSLGDKFIRSRKQRVDAVARPTPSEEVEAATSLLIFRRLRNLQAQGGASPAEYAGPLILQALKGGPAKGIATEELMSRSPLKAAASNSDAFRRFGQRQSSDKSEHSKKGGLGWELFIKVLF